MKTNKLQKNILKEWQQVKLGDVAKYTTDRIDVFKLTTNNYVGVDNILAEGGVVSSSHVPVSGRVSSYKTGDVLLSNIRPYLKKYWFAENEGGASADVLVIRANTEVILHKFLYVNLYSDKFFDHEMAGAKGVKMPRGDKAQIMEYKLHLPPLPEQNRIVSVLETWDKSIENLNKKIKIKKQIKKGLMQDLLTGKKRLVGFKDKWEVKKLADICDKENSDVSSNTLDFNNGNYPIYGASGFIKNIDFYRQNKSYISIIKDGAGVGRLTLHKAQTSVLGTLNILHENTNSDLMFLYFLLQIIDFKKYMVGSTIPHIYFRDYKKEKITIPNIKEQKVIAEILTTADEEITELEKKLSIVKDQKKYLLNNLITGAIRTPENLSVKS